MRKIRAVAVKVEGQLRDLASVNDLSDESVIEPVPLDSPEGLEIYRHSTSHVMAHAVKDLFPGTMVAIGPATDEGFYYDFDMERALTPEDLEKIEKRMKDIIKKNSPFLRKDIRRDEANEFFRRTGEDYKVEIVEEIEDDHVSVYEEDGFVDLCRGDRKSTRLNSSHIPLSRMPSSA